MARSPEALVKPDLLTWARTALGISVDEAAHSLQTKPERVSAWEAGEARPSMAQLRRMAVVYRRQLSDFYLPARPVEKALPHDFRRMPSEGDVSYSKALRYQLRQASVRRELAIDLAEELDVKLATPELPIDPRRDDPEEVGHSIRQLLRVDFPTQRTSRTPRDSYNAWRARLESVGVLVFQIAGVAPAEMLGFSLSERPLPVVGVNRKVTPNGRTFTLLHEFVHVLIGESSICDIAESVLRPPQEELREVFCNAVAGAALVPERDLLSVELVAAHGNTASVWSDEELRLLARTFGVSEHVILRRLLTLGRTTAAFYGSKFSVWKAFEPTPKPSLEDEFKRNMPQEVVSDLGRPFTRLVLDTYLDARMSLSDVSRHLGLRAQQVAKVQELVRGA